MFKFLRRVSTSFLPRPDRPWHEDATSTAPTIGRKRRFSITDDQEGDEFGSLGKKARTELVQLGGTDALPSGSGGGPVEGEEVKTVTKGVKDVDVEDNRDDSNPAVQPEVVPLPESPRGTPQPEPQASETDQPAENDSDSVPPSSEEEGEIQDPQQAVEDPTDACAIEDSEPTTANASPLEDGELEGPTTSEEVLAVTEEKA